MNINHRHWSRALATVFLTALASTAAQGQQPGYYVSQDEFARMQRRMEAYEAELRALRVERLPQADTQFASLAEEAAADAPKKEAGPKKVDTISKPTFKVGGRILVDHMMIDQDPLHIASFGNAANRTRFDSFRLNAEGDIWENVDYKAEIAFGEQGTNTDRPTAKDVYMTFKELAILQNVRIGHFKEPFSLDQLTSARFITFMERSLLDAFAPARNIGIMEFGNVFPDETLSWYTGIFRSEIDDDAVDELEDSADFSWTSRVAWNPFYDEPSGGRYLSHLGAAYSFRRYGDNTVTVARDHEMNFIFPLGTPVAINFLGGPAVLADEVQELDVEAALIYGPFHTQAEWLHVTLDSPTEADFNAAYWEVAWFLTGEHKGYKKSMHVMDRTKVLEPFFSVRTGEGVCRGWGAWELAARYSYIDANDGGVNGGRVGDVTFGLNWYANDYCRMMFNYIHGNAYSRPTSGADAGECDEFGLRAQVDW